MRLGSLALAQASFRTLAATALLAGASAATAQGTSSPTAAQSAVPMGVPAWSVASPDLPADPAIRFGTLPNGMRYALMHNATPAGSAALRLTIDAGMRDERDDELGAAHFLEHMAFNGSANIPEGELVRRLERLGLAFGADTNAQTGLDSTTFMLDLPRTDEESVATGLMILREIAGNLSLDPAAVEREKGILKSEIQVRDLPQRRRAASLLGTALPGRGIDTRMSASPAGVTAMSAVKLRAFYEGYYRPERATLVIVGDFDLAEMERRLRDRFADWRGAGAARADYAPLQPLPASVSEPAVGTFVDPAMVETIELQRISPYRGPLDSVAKVRRNLLEIIGLVALTNRLNALSRDGASPILNGQAARQDLFRSAQGFGITVRAKDGQWAPALALAEQELRRAREFGFTQAELDEANANLATGLANAVQQKAGRPSAQIAAQIVGASLTDGIPKAPETDLALYLSFAPGLTREAVVEAFRLAWADGANTVHISTKQPIPQARQAVLAALAQSARVAVSAPAEQAARAFAYQDFGPVGRVVSDQRIGDLGVRTIAFANGLQLNLKRTDFEPGRIAFQLEVGNGLAAFPQDKPGLSLMTSLVTPLDGLEAHDIDELRRIMAGRAVSYGLVGTPGAIVAQGQTTAADLPLQAQLLAATLTASGFRPETQTQWAARAAGSAQGLSAIPTAVLGLALEYVLAGEDARMGFGDPAEVARLSLADLRTVLEPQLETGPMALALVGDFDEDAAIASVASTLGALPPRAPRGTGGPVAEAGFAADRTLRVLRHTGAPDQGALALSWPTTDDSDFRSSLARMLLASVFQLRLVETIREELGATYTPQAVSAASDTYPGIGHITVLVTVQPSAMDAVAQAVRKIAADLAAAPPSADEVLRARNPVLEQFGRQERTNAGWSALVAQAQSEPERLDRRRQRSALLQSIEPAELQSAARTWLAVGDPLEIRVLPGNTPE